MIVARRFVEVIVTAGMLVGLLVVSRGGEEKPTGTSRRLAGWF